ncbi:MAG TPA: two-component system response regulator [Lachnospiraceae bacterium]|jgi:putative two-component system response regulator|nr:two-component system response regulator [Lachnospiraceae bacterium]HBI74643.1 two-component system response regulator [Lachnospiraceae bacterium]HBY71086.1 two-component system response regulator [Lachnospiraceae bacterium]HCA69687.1 two-component system response regulator [Lachnospiraceae bacterium]HCM12572.1 two-component system response regulator [Lachnospiraceae bacterium]
MEQVSYKKANILVVDDINANLIILTEIIRNAGYIARPVTSAERAMSAIEALFPHMILLDISMPNISGFEFCARLKKSARTRDIPILFITSCYSREEKMKCFKLGAVDYIAQPFDVDEITVRINTHLKIYKMQQELEFYNKRLHKIINGQIHKIYEEQKNVMYALTRLVEMRDNRINHLERIGKNSRLLAMGMELMPRFREEVSTSFIETIELAAKLHDIGKIAIKDSIVLKPTKLTNDELEILKTHCEIGANALKEIFDKNEQNQFGRMAINIAWAHHESWDGSGYPRGLSGTDIPLCARIVTLVDSYDVLISEKNAKTAYFQEKCVERINMDAGTRFDPEIVKVFNKIYKQFH